MLTCLLVCPHDSYVAAVEVEVVLGTDCYLTASSTSPASRLGTQSQDKTSLAGPGALALCCPPRRPLVKVGPSFHLIWDTALCSTRSHALYLHHTMLRRWFMEFLFIYAIIFHGIKYLFRLFNTRNIKM